MGQFFGGKKVLTRLWTLQSLCHAQDTQLSWHLSLGCLLLQIGPLLNCIVDGRYTETIEDQKDRDTEVNK